MDLEVDFERGRRASARTARSGCAPYPLPIDYEGDAGVRATASAWREFEDKLLERRREYSILRVDRADLSKNVLRGFTAFDIFLGAAPRVRRAHHVHGAADAVADRRPEYAEYLEKIEALVAVVNHRHGTPDWMPIDLKLARRPRGGVARRTSTTT
jgi:trehalose 6-phosphate synthase